MVSRTISVDTFDFIAFGGTGDLARRKLLPALYQRDRAGQIVGDTRIIATARAQMTDAAYREMARAAIMTYVKASERDEAGVTQFLNRLSYVCVDATGDNGWKDLAAALKGAKDRTRVFYLATSPDIFGAISAKLGAHGLITPATRVVIEKPVGKSFASATVVNDAVGKPDGAAVCECPVRADLECRPYRPCPDHGGRVHRLRGPGRLL